MGRQLGTPYAVRVLWTRGLPSYGIDAPPHEVDKGIGPVLLGDFAYCPKCGGWWARGLSAATWWKGFWLSSAGGSFGGSSAAFCGYAS